MQPAEFALNEAQDLVGRQEHAVESLRTRSVALLGSAGVIGGLFAGRVFNGPVHGWRHLEVVVALVAFTIAACCTVVIQWPRRFGFSIKIERLLAQLTEEAEVDLEAEQLKIARSIAKMLRSNEKAVRRLHLLHSGACALLVVQVLGWALAALTN